MIFHRCGGETIRRRQKSFVVSVAEQQHAAFIQSVRVCHFGTNGAGVDIFIQSFFLFVFSGAEACLRINGTDSRKKEQKRKKDLEHDRVSLNNGFINNAAQAAL